MSKLVFERNSLPVFEFPLRKLQNWIGRSDCCELSLNGPSISRRHCLIERRSSKWILRDRSKHGTLLNGVSVKRGDLSYGDRLEIGPYRVLFVESDPVSEPTTDMVKPQPQAHVLRAQSDSICLLSAVLVVENGQRFSIDSPECSVGAVGSDIVISKADALPHHAILKTERGRVMLAPSAGPVYVDGQKLNDLTPIYEGERVQIGGVVCSFETCIKESFSESESFGNLIGHSSEMKKVFGLLKRFSAHDFHVLITGESGTGKEVAARAIHSSSGRSAGPFVPINCAALPDNLLESELFGHVKGAFTGAIENRKGAFERADGGVLFLDELAEMPMSAQAKLLRVLENGEVRALGASKCKYPNVRIIAATNANMSQAVRSGRMREDLYYRLQVLSIHLPPLRLRIGDVPALAKVLLRQLHPNAQLSSQAISKLQSHDWPGNIRELRNVLTRAYVMSGPSLNEQSILLQTPSTNLRPDMDAREFEESYLKSLLLRHRGNRSAVARELGVARTTLLYRLKKHALN